MSLSIKYREIVGA